jgi:small nuclear ribonucleoprotein (snRNP)-like protein
VTGPEHYSEAERLLQIVDDGNAADTLMSEEQLVAMAQVHATLAVADATGGADSPSPSELAAYRALVGQRVRVELKGGGGKLAVIGVLTAATQAGLWIGDDDGEHILLGHVAGVEPAGQGGQGGPEDGELRLPPLIRCQHCPRQISRDYGVWRHVDTERIQCTPSGPHSEQAEPEDDPAAREFAADLIGERVGVTLLSGEYVAGVLVGSQGWVLTVRGSDRRFPDGMRDVRVEVVRHVRSLTAQDGGGDRG